MITARIQSYDSRGGKTAKPIGFQPLPTESRAEVTASFLIELNHVLSLSPLLSAQCHPERRQFVRKANELA